MVLIRLTDDSKGAARKMKIRQSPSPVVLTHTDDVLPDFRFAAALKCAMNYQTHSNIMPLWGYHQPVQAVPYRCPGIH